MIMLCFRSQGSFAIGNGEAEGQASIHVSASRVELFLLQALCHGQVGVGDVRRHHRRIEQYGIAKGHAFKIPAIKRSFMQINMVKFSFGKIAILEIHVCGRGTLERRLAKITVLELSAG